MRKFTSSPDQDYDVQLCRNCKHPGGQHIDDDGCKCGQCPGWAPGGIGRWCDEMTDALAVPSPAPGDSQ
jgi:hypothetical protein